MRKQLFVVRTSGARLLALINDVMDAATLRQHRLVLKQERLGLRQVVGDVVDLTRSLVGDTEGGGQGKRGGYEDRGCFGWGCKWMAPTSCRLGCDTKH